MKTLLATMTVLVGLSGVAAAQPYPPLPPMYQEVVPRPWGPRSFLPLSFCCWGFVRVCACALLSFFLLSQA